MPKLFKKGEVKVGDHVQLVATNTWPTKTAGELKRIMSMLKHHMGTVKMVFDGDMVLLQWDRPDAQVFYEQETQLALINAAKDLQAVVKIDTIGEREWIHYIMKTCPNCGRNSHFYDDSHMIEHMVCHYYCHQCSHQYTSLEQINIHGLYAERFIQDREENIKKHYGTAV